MKGFTPEKNPFLVNIATKNSAIYLVLDNMNVLTPVKSLTNVNIAQNNLTIQVS